MASIAKASASYFYKIPGLLVGQSSKRLLEFYTIAPFQIPSFVKCLHIPINPEIPPREHIDYEVSKCPKEWKFVEQIMPRKTVPEPVKKQEYPSGWKPPEVAATKLPYFIRRSKNHMLSIYLVKTIRGQRTRTKISKISGDIWALNQDLQLYLKEKHNKDVLSQVHEVTCCIWLKGDYVRDVEEWMLQRGF